MSEQYCIKCGAGLVAGARFCRHCGQPLPDSQITSVTEGTTAIFPAYAEAPTQHFNQPTAERPTTGPTFMSQPGEGSPAGTHGLATKKKRGGKVLLISSVFIIFLAFVSLAVLGGILRRMNRRPHPPPSLPSRPSV
ncbi:MAG TPA: zinc ribbon domain-containing protein, partial [Pyrinomonadaceae bacterium]|nr:zinc ribbon domain-containing protein [Pyrinomonadaceae bacterium]